MSNDQDSFDYYGETTFKGCYMNCMDSAEKCDVLPDCNKKPEVFCAQCNKKLCRVCHIYHNNFQKDHNIEYLSDKFTNKLHDEKQAHFGIICAHYSPQKPNMFCMLCETLLCQPCAEEDHIDHRTVSFDTAVADTKQMYDAVMKECEKVSLKTNASIEEINQLMKLHDEIYLATVEQFSDFVAKLKNLLDKKKDEQLAELQSEANKVRSSMRVQLEFRQRQQEAEKHLSFLVHLFDKNESRMQWLALRKSFRSMWQLIDNQHPPPFKYCGVASFLPNNAIARCIEEMALGTLQIALSEKEKTENTHVTVDDDATVSSGYAETEHIDAQSVGQLEHDIVHTDRARTNNGTASGYVDYMESKAGTIHKTVLNFEGAYNHSAVTFDPHTNTLLVSVKDKDGAGNKGDKSHLTPSLSAGEFGYTEGGFTSENLEEVYEDMIEDEEISLAPLPTILSPTIDKNVKHPAEGENRNKPPILYKNQTEDKHQQRPLCSPPPPPKPPNTPTPPALRNIATPPALPNTPPPPVPPIRRKKSSHCEASKSMTVADFEHKDVTQTMKRRPRLPLPLEVVRNVRRSSCF